MLKNKKGFTLLELLSVIVVIAILSTLAATISLGMIDKMKDKVAIEMRGSLQDAALTWAVSQKKLFLEKCTQEFSNQFENQNLDINTISDTEKCAKKVDVGTLINDNIFEDPKEYCAKNEKVIIYHYCNSNDKTTRVCEYKSYVNENACKGSDAK